MACSRGEYLFLHVFKGFSKRSRSVRHKCRNDTVSFFANLTPSFLHPDLDTEVLERPVAMLAHAAHCCANLLSQFMTA